MNNTPTIITKEVPPDKRLDYEKEDGPITPEIMERLKKILDYYKNGGR